MRLVVFIANSAIAIFFLVVFVSTFLGRQQIERLARDFVTAKTIKFAAPVVDLADAGLKSPVARKLLTKEQVTTCEDEIAEFRKTPGDYIAALTGRRDFIAPLQIKNPSVVTVLQWKQKVRDYYSKVLGRLLGDLRIFIGSNIAAALIGIWFAYRATGKAATQMAWLSCLLVVSVVYCASMYIDRLSFFTILFNSYMGWWYPVLLIVTFIYLYLASKNTDRRENIDTEPVP